MLFSVIYTIDIPKNSGVFGNQDYLEGLKPPKYKKLWTLTEYYDEFCNDNLTMRHRKYCALLTKNEFIHFIVNRDLFFDDVETMGSLGAPGFGFGWSPAFSFSSSDENVLQNAYVTPIPEVNRKSGFTERDWNRLKRVLKYMFQA